MSFLNVFQSFFELFCSWRKTSAWNRFMGVMSAQKYLWWSKKIILNLEVAKFVVKIVKNHTKKLSFFSFCNWSTNFGKFSVIKVYWMKHTFCYITKYFNIVKRIIIFEKDIFIWLLQITRLPYVSCLFLIDFFYYYVLIKKMIS